MLTMMLSVAGGIVLAILVLVIGWFLLQLLRGVELGWTLLGIAIVALLIAAIGGVYVLIR